MDLLELVAQIKGVADWRHPDKIKLFGWYLHTFKQVDRFDQAAIRNCYDAVHWAKPANVSPYFAGMLEKRPPELLRDFRGYRLEGRIRSQFDAKYGQRQSAVVVDRLLSDLPAKVPDLAERAFVGEALACFRAGAFRATIVMTWNLAFDHLLRWILKNPSTLAAFNARIPIRYPKKNGLTIQGLDDFEGLKESEILEVCSSAGLYSSNISKILKEKLDRRNMAAHPSELEVTQLQAEDVVSDLVVNVVLRLT